MKVFHTVEAWIMKILKKIRWKNYVARIGDKNGVWFKLEQAFGYDSRKNVPVIIAKNPEDIPENLWFVGDIHGDILALNAIIRLIDEQTPEATIVFLGDLFDRHAHGYESVTRVLELMRTRPGRILWLAGNHDVGLKFNRKKFHSDCNPSDFATYLNSKKHLRKFGRELCNFIEHLPRALFLPDGLVCTHGGVPHDDIQQRLATVGDLHSSDALRDFTWGRIHSTAPRKYPNRDTAGGELGHENVKSFFRKAEELLRLPVKRIVCGHQHPDNKGKGVEIIEGIPALILNSSVFSENIFRKNSWMTPYVAKYRKDQLPEAVPLELSPEEITKFYGKPGGT